MVAYTEGPGGVDRSDALGGGALAGIVGGVAVLAFNYLAGATMWGPQKLASLPFLGERALVPGFDAVAIALGLAVHFLVAVTWGVLFGVLMYGLTRGATVLAGLVWGILVWLVMAYVVLPLVGGWTVTQDTSVGRMIGQHVVFGLVLALSFLPFQRRLPGRGALPLLAGLGRRSPASP